MVLVKEVKSVFGNVVDVDVHFVKTFDELSEKAKRTMRQKIPNPEDCCYVFGIAGSKRATVVVDKSECKRIKKALDIHKRKIKKRIYDKIYGRRGLVDPDEALFRKGQEFDWRW